MRNAENLRQALELQEQVDELNNQIEELLGGETDQLPAPVQRRRVANVGNRTIQTATGTKRTYSPESIQRIRDAQKARWAKIRKENREKEKAANQPANVTPAPTAAPEAAPAAAPAPVATAPAAPAPAPAKSEKAATPKAKTEKAALIAA